ncbi:baseplate J/gp47 family protein [Treponema socranskii]|uniref:baseplate J/gp47 family protein n=1 Tax=Treponema socranskii TaxID=53419 RepID=UPI003D908012
MALVRESLAVLLDRMYAAYMSRFKPLDQTARHNLIRVLSEVQAGMYHQLLGDLSFLADQLFPDTATGDYLRMHWSDRVPPLYAVSAVGQAEVKGVAGTAVPSGLVYTSASGKRYFTDKATKIDSTGKAEIWLQAEEAGAASNLSSGQKLKLSSAIPTGLSSEAITLGGGIVGGVDEETDEEYLSRVLLALRNTTRYGKIGDFAAWAVDSSADVSKAFEFKNFSTMGALLIQVISGSHIDDSIHQVGNLSVVTSYIDSVAPPVLYTVRTPTLRPINMTITLLAAENSSENQGTVESRIKTYFNASARPGVRYTEGSFRDAIVDGIKISWAKVELTNGSHGEFTTTILEYPIRGTVRFVIK